MTYPKYPNGKLRPDLSLSVQFPMDSHYSWFQSLADQLTSPDVAIISDHEDDKPTQYSFSSPYLTGLSPKDTLCRVKKLSALLSGAMLVLGCPWMDRPLSIQGGWYWDEGKRERVFTGNDPGSAREFPEEINNFSYRAWPIARPLSIEGKLLFLCHSDKVTYSILTIVGHLGITYASLYSVLDCLKGAGGMTDDSVARLGGATKAELKRFTATANNFEVLGVQARHGNLDWAVPKQPSLPLDESRKLILGAAKQFLLGRVTSHFPRAWATADGPAL